MPGPIERERSGWMWRNGLSLNKKPSDDMRKAKRASGWEPLLSHFAMMAAP
jgi:hypothetical protein